MNATISVSSSMTRIRFGIAFVFYRNRVCLTLQFEDESHRSFHTMNRSRRRENYFGRVRRTTSQPKIRVPTEKSTKVHAKTVAFTEVAFKTDAIVKRHFG